MRPPMLVGSRDAPTTRDGPGREERAQRRGGRQPAALFGGRDAAVRGQQRQLHLHRRVVEPRPHLEPRIAEDFDHRPVLGHRRRLKAREAVGRRERRQRSNSSVAMPLPVQVIVDGERGLGDGVGHPEIRGRGDDPLAASERRQAISVRLSAGSAAAQNRSITASGGSPEMKNRCRRASGDSS